MTTAPHTYLLPLAVIDEPSGKICIWHIDVGPDIGLPRLSGGWVLEPDDTDTITTLIRGRHVVLCNGTELLTRENITTAGTVDIDATVDAVMLNVMRCRLASTLTPRHAKLWCLRRGRKSHTRRTLSLRSPTPMT